MVYTPLEKGYECPNSKDSTWEEEGKTCDDCPLKTTKCIIFSKAGQKRLKELKEYYSRKGIRK